MLAKKQLHHSSRLGTQASLHDVAAKIPPEHQTRSAKVFEQYCSIKERFLPALQLDPRCAALQLHTSRQLPLRKTVSALRHTRRRQNPTKRNRPQHDSTSTVPGTTVFMRYFCSGNEHASINCSSSLNNVDSRRSFSHSLSATGELEPPDAVEADDTSATAAGLGGAVRAVSSTWL